jgi:hypothetical protein
MHCLDYGTLTPMSDVRSENAGFALLKRWQSVRNFFGPLRPVASMQTIELDAEEFVRRDFDCIDPIRPYRALRRALIRIAESLA